MSPRVKIDDIARMAGVSKATVSRVLNQKPDVDPATRDRILQIMREQGFVRNIAAEGIARGRNRIVGMLAPSLTWPMMPEIMRGVGQMLERTDYELILYSLSHQGERATVLDRILATKLTSGLMAVFPGAATAHIAALHAPNFPVVIIDDQGLPTGTPWIGADNRGGAYQATRHLLQLGHRRIAYVGGPSAYQCTHERFEGYTKALAEAGIITDPSLILPGDYEIPGGREAARVIFSMADRPTAIFASSDLMAYGILEIAAQTGVRIPDDIALVGFDDIMPSAHTIPALTTVRQPFFEMANQAISTLLDLVGHSLSGNGRSTPSPTTTVATDLTMYLPTQLITRASCGVALGPRS